MDVSRRSVVAWGAMSIVGVLVCGRGAKAQQRGNVLAESLIDLEHSINWLMVRPTWGRQRVAWVAAVRAARTPAQVAAQLGPMEAAIDPNGVVPGWAEQRAAWVGAVGAARTRVQVAHALLTLEGNIQWGATSSGWHVLRTRWIAALQAVR